MSGTVETRRVAAPQPPPVDTHAAESARPAAPPTSAAEIREAAIASVDTARASHTAARRSPTWQDAAGAVARAYDDGGLPGLRSHLARHPESLRAIATAPRAQVEELMSDVAGSWDGPAALEEIQSQVAGRLREGVRRRALSTIDRHCGQLERMRSFAHDNLDALRTAPADSPEGELAAKLGIGPKASQALVDARIDGALEGLSDLRARFYGNAWEPGDFPASAQATVLRERLTVSIAEDTVVDAVMDVRSYDERGVVGQAVLATEAAHAGMTGAELLGELAVIGNETVAASITGGGHIAFGEAVLVANISLGVFGVGMAVGHKIHHMAEEQREHAIGEARDLGI